MTEKEIIIFALIAFLSSAFNAATQYQLIQHYQLCAYHIGEYFVNIKKSLILKLTLISISSVIIGAIIMNFTGLAGENWGYLGLFAYLGAQIGYFFYIYSRKYKTPLKYTHRIIRFLIIFIFINFITGFGIIYLFSRFIPIINYNIIGIMPIFNYLICGISAIIAAPIESLSQSRYIFLAKKKLVHMPNLKIIGITGSFGKTSVKFILQKMLESKYKVCVSPNSFNTTMGLCRAINESLKAEDEIFIAEMGARKIGDIKKLCEIARPDIAVITAVDKQHLATFKTIENVAKAKFEIIEEKRNNGFSVFNGDSQYCRILFDKCKTEKIMTSGEEFSKYCYAYYFDYKCGNTGNKFMLAIGGENPIECNTSLLGRHNISNITLSSAIAHRLGVKIEDIKQIILDLKPTQHRLQLIDTGTEITIIDDSFNANLEGAKIALEVLNEFEQKKVVITAGLVDMGKEQKEVNIQLGEEISKHADWCIITGPNSIYIYDGLVKQNFPLKNIRICDTLNQAMTVLNIISGSKVVLFQNDLPDNY